MSQTLYGLDTITVDNDSVYGETKSVETKLYTNHLAVVRALAKAVMASLKHFIEIASWRGNLKLSRKQIGFADNASEEMDNATTPVQRAVLKRLHAYGYLLKDLTFGSDKTNALIFDRNSVTVFCEDSFRITKTFYIRRVAIEPDPESSDDEAEPESEDDE